MLLAPDKVGENLSQASGVCNDHLGNIRRNMVDDLKRQTCSEGGYRTTVNKR